MKRFTYLLLAATLLVPVMGCKKAATTTATQALAPGYVNHADQLMGQTLVGAHAFYMTIQQDVAAGKYTPSAAEKTALNNFALALNSAQLIYIGYHAGTQTQAAAQTAVDSLTTQQTVLQNTITGGK